jgi:hypothetical protein
MGTVDLRKSGKTARPQTRSARLPGTGKNRQDAPQPSAKREGSPLAPQPSAKREGSPLAPQPSAKHEGSPLAPQPSAKHEGSPLDALERIFREHSGRFSNQLGAKLPGEAMPRLDEKVYNFISQNFRIISDSFPALNDGLTRSHGLASEGKNTAVRTTAIEMMLESSGGADHFNRGEIEKSNRQWGIDDIEAYTDNMLRQKAGIGSVVDSKKANSVVTCVFKDNAKKPKTVTDLRLAVNIPETELIDPETRFRARAAYLIKDIICRHLHENIDREINTEDNDSGDFLDRLLNDRLEINSADLEQHLQNIDRHDKIEEIRNKGFSAAFSLLVSILNSVNLDFQFMENMKEKRELLIREYEDSDEAVLPDEHYQIRLRYFSKARLIEEREVYDERLKSLSGETLRLWDLLEVIYQDSKSVFKVNDFEDLFRKNKNRINDLIKNRTPLYDPPKNIEAPLAPPQGEKEEIRVLLARMEERIKNISDSMYPVERQISEERLSMLKNAFSDFENCINPYNLQPGILVDIDLTSIKRKRTTLDSMASALGSFLDNVSTCFRDVT